MLRLKNRGGWKEKVCKKEEENKIAGVFEETLEWDFGWEYTLMAGTENL